MVLAASCVSSVMVVAASNPRKESAASPAPAAIPPKVVCWFQNGCRLRSAVVAALCDHVLGREDDPQDEHDRGVREDGVGHTLHHRESEDVDNGHGDDEQEEASPHRQRRDPRMQKRGRDEEGDDRQQHIGHQDRPPDHEPDTRVEGAPGVGIGRARHREAMREPRVAEGGEDHGQAAEQVGRRSTASRDLGDDAEDRERDQGGHVPHHKQHQRHQRKVTFEARVGFGTRFWHGLFLRRSRAIPLRLPPTKYFTRDIASISIICKRSSIFITLFHGIVASESRSNTGLPRLGVRGILRPTLIR